MATTRVDGFDLDGTHHPMATIANKLGPEGVGLVAGLMDQNRRDQEWVDEALRGSQEREIERWKTRALDAEEELRAVRNRISWLMTGQEGSDLG